MLDHGCRRAPGARTIGGLLSHGFPCGRHRHLSLAFRSCSSLRPAFGFRGLPAPGVFKSEYQVALTLARGFGGPLRSPFGFDIVIKLCHHSRCERHPCLAFCSGDLLSEGAFGGKGIELTNDLCGHPGALSRAGLPPVIFADIGGNKGADHVQKLNSSFGVQRRCRVNFTLAGAGGTDFSAGLAGSAAAFGLETSEGKWLAFGLHASNPFAGALMQAHGSAGHAFRGARSGVAPPVAGTPLLAGKWRLLAARGWMPDSLVSWENELSAACGFSKLAQWHYFCCECVPRVELILGRGGAGGGGAGGVGGENWGAHASIFPRT